MSWFNDLTRTQQADYIKKHPNSKYAKSTKSKTTAKSTKTAVKSKTTGNGRTEYIALNQDLAFATSASEKAKIKKKIEAHRLKYNL